MKKSKDVKFIIYQALYIFVVCVIAIKGADINLDPVEIKRLMEPSYAYIDTVRNVVIDKNEYAKLIQFDSSKYLIVSKEDYKKDPDKFPPPIGIYPDDRGLFPPPPPPIDDPPPVNTGNDPTITWPGNLNLVQFRQNSIQNPNNADMIVTTSAGTVNIPSKSTKTITIMGDNTITLSVGGVSKSFSVKENKKPMVEFKRITTMNDETKVTTLQRNIGFRVTVNDDYPDQLEVKINGQVSYKKVTENIYDVTMNAFGSISSYENFIAGKPSPYSVGFTVSVTDKISGHKTIGQNSFTFGEW